MNRTAYLLVTMVVVGSLGGGAAAIENDVLDLITGTIQGHTDPPSDGKAQAEAQMQAQAGSAPPDHARSPRGFAPCVQGMADEFACHQVDLLYHFPMEEIGGGQAVGSGRGSDVWGWTDPQTRREYVLAGRENGTAIVDITDPKRPVYIANLPSASSNNVIWRDIKVHADHAFVVAEATNHGMQVLDLTQLRDVDPDEAPVTLSHTAHYPGFLRAHNIAINEETGFAYAVGAREDVHACGGGLHMIDIGDPTSPAFAGCFSEDGYIHDTQCVVYRGPDERFQGREICFNSSPSPHTVSITDVTDKDNPALLSATPYPQSGYAHQGWLTEDHAYFLFGDELDEINLGHNTQTYVWDMADLTSPEVIGVFESTEPATDHNMYVKNRYLFQSNYRAGLRVLDLRNVADGDLREVAFFDVYPPGNGPGFSFGTWSNYPYFDSGVVAVHGYQGLWLVKPRLGERRP